MLHVLRRTAVACTVLGAIALTPACAFAPADDPLAAVQSAVAEEPDGIEEIVVDDGIDGLSRYVFLQLKVSGEELTPEALAATLDQVGDVLPDAFDEVRVVARSDSSGERVDLDEAFAATGMDSSYLVSPQRLHLTADAVRAFADAQ